MDFLSVFVCIVNLIIYLIGFEEREEYYMVSDFETQLNELLERAKDIKAPINAAPLGININEYNMPSEIWMNDVQIFYENYLKDYALGERIKSLLLHRGLGAYSNLVSCLQSVSKDRNFVNKKKQIFPRNSMDLLQQLLEEDNPVEYMQSLFRDLGYKSDSRLRAMMRDLKEKGYIITSWADNVPYSIEFNEKAYTTNEKSRSEMQNGTYIINNITNGNANINSTDNSVRNTNISYNDTKIFEEMLEVASSVTEENKSDIIMAIEDMKNNYNKPSLKEKYYKFIEVAANHMALFVPFIPALTEMAKQYSIM